MRNFMAKDDGQFWGVKVSKDWGVPLSIGELLILIWVKINPCTAELCQP